MGKTITKDGKRKHKPKGTTLWYVYLDYDKGYVVKVSNKPLPLSRKMLRIRTLSANAAGRKYVRDNALHDIAIQEYELEGFGVNKHSVDVVEDWMKERLKKFYHKNNIRIEVIKQP